MHISQQLLSRTARFLTSMCKSENEIIQLIANRAKNHSCGPLGRNYVYICKACDKDVSKCTYNDIKQQIMSKVMADNTSNIVVANCIVECCATRDGLCNIESLELNDINEIILSLCVQ